MNDATASRRRFWPRSLAGKTTAAAVLLVGAIAVAYFVAKNAMANRLEAAWKLSEEFGLPRDLDGLLGEKVPDKENAAYALEAAASIASRRLDAERKRFSYQYEDLHIKDPTFLAAMDQLLADPDYEKSLADADRRPGYHSLAVFGSPLVMTKLAHIEAQRELVKAEQAIARRLASLGKREEAVRRLLRMSRLTRRWEDKEPFLVASLANTSIRTTVMWELNLILREGAPLPAGLHDEIEREYAKTEDFLKILPRVAEVEKLLVVAVRDKWPLPGLPVVNRFSRDEDLAFMIRQIHGAARTFDRPFYQAKHEIDAFDKEFLAMFKDPIRKSWHAGARFLTPAMNLGRKSADRLIALSRCLRIVNAMARKNDFAAGWNSLGLPIVVLVDPFDGKPLRIKPTSNGPIVYSISYDLKDDGGVLVNPTFKDVGLSPLEIKVEAK